MHTPYILVRVSHGTFELNLQKLSTNIMNTYVGVYIFNSTININCVCVMQLELMPILVFYADNILITKSSKNDNETSSHHACVHAKSLKSCPTLCDPVDCSLSGFSVHGIL